MPMHSFLPRLPLIVIAALPLAACTVEMDNERQVNAPAINVVGEPRSCIQVSRIKGTDVSDDYTIDFEMTDGTLYRNTLDGRCFSLGFEKSFSYNVQAGSLCSADTIQVLHGDGSPGSVCGLGEFIPVELVDRR